MKAEFLLKILFVCVLAGFAFQIFSVFLTKEKRRQSPDAPPPQALFSDIALYDGQSVFMENLRFVDTEGREKTITDLQGGYVVLNAWATWCTPCVKELPALQNLHETLKNEGWEVLAISVDTNKSLSDIARFVEGHDAGEIAAYWDSQGDLQNLLVDVGGIPVTYILSPRGEILARISGAAYWDSPPVVDFLRSLQKN